METHAKQRLKNQGEGRTPAQLQKICMGGHGGGGRTEGLPVAVRKKRVGMVELNLSQGSRVRDTSGANVTHWVGGNLSLACTELPASAGGKTS